MPADDIILIKKQIRFVINTDKNQGIKESYSQPLSTTNMKKHFQKKYPKDSEDEIKIR